MLFCNLAFSRIARKPATIIITPPRICTGEIISPSSSHPKIVVLTGIRLTNIASMLGPSYVSVLTIIM